MENKWFYTDLIDIDETLTGTTTPGQGGCGGNGNEGISDLPEPKKQN